MRRRVTLLIMVNISYVGGCMVRMTILPLAAHCLRYSTGGVVHCHTIPYHTIQSL